MAWLELSVPVYAVRKEGEPCNVRVWRNLQHQWIAGHAGPPAPINPNTLE